MEPDDYLDYVHQIDHSPLEPNPALGAALEKLPGRKLILTNGTKAHADAVMRRLAIDHHFEDVFDIVAGELEPKPLAADLRPLPRPPRRRSGHGRDVRGSRPQPRRAARARHDHGAGGAAEHPRGLPRRLGARRARRAHVDHVTDDLAGFLEATSRASRAAALTLTGRSATQPRSTGDVPCRMTELAKIDRRRIRAARRHRSRDQGPVREAVERALDLLDRGAARVAERQADGSWHVNQWLKKAVLLSFRLNDMSVIRFGAEPGARAGVGQGAARNSTAGAASTSSRRSSAPCRARSCAAPPISRRTWC